MAEETPIDQTEWQRLEAEYKNATPQRQAEIDERLDELEWEAGQLQDAGTLRRPTD